MQVISIPETFNGPPHSGNGGWVSGHLAALLSPGSDEAVSVRLSSPPPLARELTVTSAPDGGLSVVAGETPVASAALADVPDGPLPTPVSFAIAQASGRAYEGLADHPFPTCYSCGTGRPDGLGLRPGRVAEGDGAYAASWMPRAGHDTIETAWAAIDCPGGWSAGIAGRPMVLGTMTAWVGALPIVGAEHVIMAWPTGSAGRRFFSGTALYADGRLIARADATWISVDPTTVKPVGGAA